MRNFALALTLLMSSTPALAEDHLEPAARGLLRADPTWFDFRELQIKYSAGFAPGVQVRMFEDDHPGPLHPIGGTSLVAVGANAGRYFVRKFSETRLDPTVRHCDQALPAPLGRRVVKLWRTMVMQSQYRETGRPVDRSWILFSAPQPGEAQAASAVTFAPAADTEADFLVKIARGLGDYCSSKDPKLLTGVAGAVADLEKRLK